MMLVFLAIGVCLIGHISSVTPSTTCENDAPSLVCESLSQSGKCVHLDIRSLCPEQCGVCNGTISKDKDTSPLPTRNPIQVCEDEMPDLICTELKNQGKCNMCAVQILCTKMCGACAGTTPDCVTSEDVECVDKSPICGTMASSCDSDPVVRSFCPETCGLCPTTPMPTTTPKPKPPRKCRQCGNRGNGGAPCSAGELLMEKFTKPKDCPGGEQYCIVDVEIVGGKRSIYKRCANYETCRRDWYQLSSDKASCTSFNPMDTSIQSLDCHFCCTQNGCNKGYKPVEDSLFDDLD